MTKLILRRMAGLALAALMAVGAQGQIVGEDEQALRQQQADLFQQIFDRPDDLDLMFQYALLSIRLKDYEAAISTLDRILIFNPDLPRVRLELAASYFRIGSYPISRHYFAQVLDHPETSDEMKERVAEFLAVIDQRTRESYVTGAIEANALFSTNANNAADSREIEFLGQTVTLLGNEVTAQQDIGASISAQFAHVYDLGGVNQDVWRTDLALYSQRYESTESGAVDVGILRTGPFITLTPDRYGPKGRPFVELDHVRSENDSLYSTIGAGFEYRDTISPDLTLNATLRGGWREYHNGPRFDGVNLRANAGLDWFQNDALTLRLKTLFEFDGADDRSERSYEVSAEAGVVYRYDSGFEIAARRWQAGASARITRRWFDEPGIANTTKTRKDFDLRLSANNTAYLMDGWAVVSKVDFFLRDSNIRNFDIDGITLSLGMRYNF
ncbi:MAG: surface lipoprotein assembly modifier [Pseudomonadota bacterium]